MSAAADAFAADPDWAAPEDPAACCHHCMEPLPAHAVRLTLDRQVQAFCCDGCAAAARWIQDAELGDYYRLRSARAGRVDGMPQDFDAWDRDDVQAGHVRDDAAGREITLVTDGMHCAACAWLIDRALTREPGVREVSANAITGRVRIVWDPALTPLSAVLRRLVALGYTPYLTGGSLRERERRAQRNRSLLRLGIAGLASLQAMMFAEALYLDTAGQMSLPTRDFFRWVTFLVATPVVFYSGWPFLAGAWRELRERRPGMDILVASGTLLAYGGSVVETLRGGPQVWYDAAVMFVFLLLAARLLEQRTRATASAQVDALAQARPTLATRELPDGSRQLVPLSALACGDIACVASGEVLPADGVLLDPAAQFSEALLTGESQPVARHAGDDVYAGTLSADRPVRLRVTRAGAATRLSDLARLVERAQAQRPRLARFADRLATRFVLVLLIAAALVTLVWLRSAPERAFEVLLALLVVSCPCALSLSVPAALAAAHGTLSRLGLLALRPDALETLARSTDLVFDKTGTLSTGDFALGDVQYLDGTPAATVLAQAAALERDSRHPLAGAFVAHADPRILASHVREHAGMGIEGTVDGRSLRLGTAAFAAGGSDDGRLWLGDGERAIACFTVVESGRPEAAEALEALRSQGLTLHVYSGDAPAAVERLATRLGIADAAARLSPQDKLARVRTLQSQGRIVAMIGDGLNDAPVLAGADVSIAVAQGAALAQRAADFVMTHASLTRIPAAIALARRTQRIIRQNLFWAVAYNIVALPLAATGHVTPWIAALAMVVSSLTVTGNALRLVRP